MAERATIVHRHESSLGSWEMVRRGPALPGVHGYTGYWEDTPAPLRRTEVAQAGVAIIISFGPSIHVVGSGQHVTSFVAGVDDRPEVTEHAGRQHGVQLDLAPPAAAMLLGVPMSELAGRVVELPDVLGREGAELPERLAGLPGWAERFALLDEFVARRIDRASPPSPDVLRAWSRLVASDGRVPIATLAAELGCSRRHLAARFREEVGLPPKAFARILRFARAKRQLERDDGSRLAEIAADCGYYDQPHLNRDFRDLAGCSPLELLARRLPDDGGTAAGDEVTFVQEGLGAAA